ncbi:hypothetical protein FPV67DRAFT_113436 [Lyophyllum atratum]|nr:hypothetical protein FPV67DRAFT_113436 [Lyophyllum atratum]
MVHYCYWPCASAEKSSSFWTAWVGAGYDQFLSISAGGVTKYTQENAGGGGKAKVIKPGKPFGGRMQGGGTRDQIFGTWEYGSGYPGNVGHGVSGRGFPFYFWPVVWIGDALSNDDPQAYLHASTEYGLSSNNERPGDFLVTAAFGSNVTGNVYRILADNATATYLIPRVAVSCLSFLNFTSVVPIIYPSIPYPHPEQAVQYYRASSIALSLDGYNNTADFLREGAPPIPLPGISIYDPTLVCLNKTIGRSALLVAKQGPVNGAAQFFRFLGGFIAFVIGILLIMYLCCGFCRFMGNSPKYHKCCRRRIRMEREPQPRTTASSLLPELQADIEKEDNPFVTTRHYPSRSQAAPRRLNPIHVNLSLNRNSIATLRHGDTRLQSSSSTIVGDTEIALEEMGRRY